MRRWIACFYSDRVEMVPCGGCIIRALDQEDAACKAKVFRAEARIAVITPVCEAKVSILSQGTRARFEASMDRTIRRDEFDELTALIEPELGRGLSN